MAGARSPHGKGAMSEPIPGELSDETSCAAFLFKATLARGLCLPACGAVEIAP